MNNNITVTAIPDWPYYEWQLEIQFLNMIDLGYDLSNYHVLVGYYTAVSAQMLALAKRYPEVKWGFYPDTRKETRNYVSSIRPHLIAKHLRVNPWMEKIRFFFIDTDVIFRTLPDLHLLDDPDTWYFSETDYISLERIRGKGDHILADMCRIIGVSEESVIGAPDNGGAQIWLNDTSAEFWDGIEETTTKIHDYIKFTKPIAAKIWSKKTGLPPEDYIGLSEYLADMWVLLWICSSVNKKISIEPMLDFCRPTDPLSRWQECTMLHYSLMKGCAEPEYFIKSTFAEGVDLYWQRSGTNNDVCGRKYIDYLEKMLVLRRQLESAVQQTA
jgi:hypothetical protein